MTLAYPIVDDSEPFEEKGGSLVTVTGAELAMQRVLRLLFTNPGEIIHRPNLGGGLASFRNKQPNPTNIQRLQNQVETFLESLPFVESFEVKTSGRSTFKINISIFVSGQKVVIPEVEIV